MRAIESGPQPPEPWVKLLMSVQVPVTAATSAAIEELREREDDVDALMLAEVVSADPLMALQVFREVSRNRPPSRATDAETVLAGILLTGIGPFFRIFGPQPQVERILLSDSAALAGFCEVASRAKRAARFALGFAVHRADPDAGVLHEAALLHDFTEMLLWIYASDQMKLISSMQLSNASLRSADVQARVLGTSIEEIQRRLVEQWGLPEVLFRLNVPGEYKQAAAQTVQLAIRLSRHTARGWFDAAIPDDIREIAHLLNLGEGPTLNLVRELDER